MKKILLAFTIITFLLCGCTANTQTQQAKDDKLQVYSSFYAVYDFVNKIGGDKINLINIVPTGTEPHDWEPSINDMLNLEGADILFYNGLGMEQWLEKVKNTIENPNIQYVELSTAITPLSSGHNQAHSHTNNEEEADPHIWLNPQNVIKELTLIKDTLSSADPVNKAYYEANYKKACEDITKLDTDFKTAVNGFKSKEIIVAHEAYAYLCSAYGLTQIPIEGIMADSEPSPSKMSEITKLANEKNIKYIFFEELINSKAANAIASEIGAKLLVLNPFEGLTKEQIDSGEDYISIMYKNLENLKKALGE